MSEWISRGLERLGQLGKSGSIYLLDSFLQSGCAVCDRATSQPLCLDCQRQLEGQLDSFYLASQSYLANQSCSANQSCLVNQSSQLPPIEALGAYDGTLKRAILALKYEKKPQVAQFLGAELGRRWAQGAGSSRARPLPAPPVYVLPIPLHAQRQRQRGYNQAALLARSFCRTSGLKLLEDGLVRSQATVPQHQLGLTGRQQNLAGAFELGKSLNRLRLKLPAMRVVLIDDIYTTGVTVQSAIEVLAQSGIATVGIAVTARA